MAQWIPEMMAQWVPEPDVRKRYALRLAPGEYTLDGSTRRLGVGRLVVLAHTEAEARAEFERRLGLPAGAELPGEWEEVE